MIGDPEYKAIIPAVIKWPGGNRDGVIEEHPKCDTCGHHNPSDDHKPNWTGYCGLDGHGTQPKEYCWDHTAVRGEEKQ